METSPASDESTGASDDAEPDPLPTAAEPVPVAADTSAATAQTSAGEQAPAPALVVPVLVNQYTRRCDDDVLPGHFGRIESGEHVGEIGVFDAVVANGPDGYPDVVEVVLRNSGERVVCAYAALTPTPYGGR